MENRPSGCDASPGSNALADDAKQQQLGEMEMDVEAHEAPAPSDIAMGRVGQAHAQEDQPANEVESCVEAPAATAVERQMETEPTTAAPPVSPTAASPNKELPDISFSPARTAASPPPLISAASPVAAVPEFPAIPIVNPLRSTPPIEPVPALSNSTTPPPPAASAFYSVGYSTPPPRDLRNILMAAQANISPYRNNSTVPMSPVVEPGALHELPGFDGRRNSSPNNGAIAGLEELRNRQASEGAAAAAMDVDRPNVLDQLIQATKADGTMGSGSGQTIDAFLRLDFEDGNVYYLKTRSVIFGRAEGATSSSFSQTSGPDGSTVIGPTAGCTSFDTSNVAGGANLKKGKKKKKKKKKLHKTTSSASAGSSTTPGSSRKDLNYAPNNTYPLFRDPFAPPGEGFSAINSNTPEEDPIIHLPLPNSAKDEPPKKNISRKHARLAYNTREDRFEFEVLGKNGAFVEDEFVQSGTVLVVQGPVMNVLIGGVGFKVVMPHVHGGGFEIEKPVPVERPAERMAARNRGGKGKAALAYYSQDLHQDEYSEDEESEDVAMGEDDGEDRVGSESDESMSGSDEEGSVDAEDDESLEDDEGGAESSSSDDEDSSDSSSEQEEIEPAPIPQPAEEEKKRGRGRPKKHETELRRKEREKEKEKEKEKERALIHKEKIEAVKREKEKREREKKERERREKEKRDRERREKEKEIERQRALEREREKERERERDREKRKAEIQRIRDERAKQREREREKEKKKLFLPQPAKLEEPGQEKKLYLPELVVEKKQEPQQELGPALVPVNASAPAPEPEPIVASLKNDSPSIPPTEHFESSVVPSLEPTPPPPMLLGSEAIALAAQLQVSHLPALQPPPPPPAVHNPPSLQTPIDPALYGGVSYDQQQFARPQQTEQRGRSRAKKEKPLPKRKRTPSPEINEADLPPEALLKPAASYVVLIHEAISNSEEKSLTLPQIYKAIERKYPYYKVKVQTNGWQSSVRHNLGSHKAFCKLERSGKGWLWGIVEGVSIEKEKKGSSAMPKPQAMGTNHGAPNVMPMQSGCGITMNPDVTYPVNGAQENGLMATHLGQALRQQPVDQNRSGDSMQHVNNGVIQAHSPVMRQPTEDQGMQQTPHPPYQQPLLPQQPAIQPPSHILQPQTPRANHKPYPPPPPPNVQTNTAKAFEDAKARQALPRAPIPPPNALSAAKPVVPPANVRPPTQANTAGNVQFSPETMAAIHTIQKLIAQAQANSNTSATTPHPQSLAQAQQMLAQLVTGGAAGGADAEFVKTLVDNLKRQENRAQAAPIPPPVNNHAGGKGILPSPQSSSASSPPPPISTASSPSVVAPPQQSQAVTPTPPSNAAPRSALAPQPISKTLPGLNPKNIKNLSPAQQQALLKALLAAKSKKEAAAKAAAAPPTPGSAGISSTAPAPAPAPAAPPVKAPIHPANAVPLPAASPSVERVPAPAPAPALALPKPQQGGFDADALVKLLNKHEQNTQNGAKMNNPGGKRSIESLREGEEEGPASKKVDTGEDKSV